MRNIQVVFHHTDADGWASAAILQCQNNIPVGYKSKVSNTYIMNNIYGKDVAIVDFSFPEATMEMIQQAAKTLLWIDHHEDSEYLKYFLDRENVTGIHDKSKAAARLTWEWVHGTKEIPDAIKYVADRDIWKFEYPDSAAFNYGLSALNDSSDPASDLWKELLESDKHTDSIVSNGRVIEQKIEIDCMWHSRTHPSLVHMGDQKFILSNCTTNISECAAYLSKVYEVPVVLLWDITKGHLSLHGRGRGARDLFKGLLKGHPDACGGSIELPQGWEFLSRIYQKAIRLSPSQRSFALPQSVL